MESVDARFGARTLLGDEAVRLHASAPLEDPIVVHGDPRRFGAFAHIPELRSAHAAIAAWDGTLKLARAWSPAGARAFELFPTREQIRTLYDAGFTIVLEDVESFVPALRPLCRMLEEDLGVAAGKVNVEVFCSAGGHGRPHFDPSFTFNCQVEGKKTWRLARNERLRFAPTGMFLGRPIDPECAHLVDDTELVPSTLEYAPPIIAEPGTVVFLPPGVLHETYAESTTFAVAFAIEHTDLVADDVARRVRRELLVVPELRAARLGPQRSGLGDEARAAARELRRIADELEESGEAFSSESTRKRMRIRYGLAAERLDRCSVALRGPSVERTITLDPSLASILEWAATRSEFEPRDAIRAHAEIDPALVRGCLIQLVRTGLVEEIR